jgi:hypothetical protein
MSKLPDFASNLKYWRFLNKLAFGDSVSCPICKHQLMDRYTGKYLWCSTCRRKYRPTAHKGSWLYGMKLSPRQLFILLWCWQNRKSPDTARLIASVSYTSVKRWYERFRLNIPDESTAILSGLVQIDESYFGKQKSNQPQTIVVGAIEPDTRRVVLQVTNSRSQNCLEEFVLGSIAEGSLVVSDKWYGYNDLNVLGYAHEAWNHSIGHFAGTNQIEGLWSIIKRYLKKLYGCIPTKNLQTILNEWMARQNRPSLFASPENYLQMCLFHVS